VRVRKLASRIKLNFGLVFSFGACSRSCGGGIRRADRECNSPRPENGGKYCVGSRVRYESCETQDCHSDARDFRHIQCSMFDSNTKGIPNLPKNVRWVPKYGSEYDFFVWVLGALLRGNGLFFGTINSRYIII